MIDIEKNMVCWRCKHANLEKAKKFYESDDPPRPMCQRGAKSFYVNDWDIPDPDTAIGEHGCRFVDLGYDIREMENLKTC